MAELSEQINRLNTSLVRLQKLLEPVIELAQTPPDTSDREEIMALLEDRAQIADELDHALAREAELQSLADEASEALGAAIDEVRIVMSQTTAESTQR